MCTIKKISIATPLCFLYFIFCGNLKAGDHLTAVADSSASKKSDTGMIRARRITNREFNAVFEQNLSVSSAGQEFFAPQKTLLVADLSPNFVLINTPKLPFFFVADARVNLRLFASHGDPVKSPSYMPGGTLYFRTNRDYYLPQFISVSYTHHSNGIEGPTSNPNGTINTDSGKFTTNYYTITYHAGKRRDIDNLIITRYDALGVELHAYFIGLGYTYPLKNKYGFVRIDGNWLYNIARANSDPVDHEKKVYANWQRFDFQFTYIADKIYDYSTFDVKKRLNVSLKYYYQFPFMQNVSFLAGVGYRGQDEYNIFFQNSYAYATLGIAASLSFDMHPKE